MAGPKLIHNLLQGFNATMIAYGQTGSGKTFTMEGTGQASTRRKIGGRCTTCCRVVPCVPEAGVSGTLTLLRSPVAFVRSRWAVGRSSKNKCKGSSSSSRCERQAFPRAFRRGMTYWVVVSSGARGISLNCSYSHSLKAQVSTGSRTTPPGRLDICVPKWVERPRLLNPKPYRLLCCNSFQHLRQRFFGSAFFTQE